MVRLQLFDLDAEVKVSLASQNFSKFGGALLRYFSIQLILEMFPLFQENPGDFIKDAFPSISSYVTSVQKIIMKQRWQTFCFVFSADYEGKIFADGMFYYASKAKWKILKTLWLVDDAIENSTKSDLREVIAQESDAVIMHSRLSHYDHAQFFEIVEKVADKKQRTTVWVITEMTSHLTTSPQAITPGMLKVTLKRPGKYRDGVVYENSLRDAMSLFQLSFEESVTKCIEHSNLEDCMKEGKRETLRSVAGR